MRFLVDAQLPAKLCAWLEEYGYEAEHVSDVRGGQTPDAEIAALAEESEFILMTKDDDFMSRHPPERYRLLWLRCGNITNRALRDWLAQRWPAIVEKLDAGEMVIEGR